MDKMKFVVVGIQRSGTTLVTTSLDSHPDVLCAGELFKMRRPRKGPDVRDGGYRSYVRSSLHLRIADYVARARLVKPYLDRFFAQNDVKAVGFKLMANHLFAKQFPMIVPYLIERQISVIHIVRENVLKTYISRLMARSTGTFHATHQRRTKRTIEVPTEGLLLQLNRIATQNRQLKDIFEGHAPYISSTYERYSASATGEGRRLLSFLQVSACDLHSPLTKLTSDDLSTTIENIAAVRKCLQGTEFEQWT